MSDTHAVCLDLRPLAAAERHATLTRAYTTLPPGTPLLLTADGDAGLLLAGLRREFGSAFTWSATDNGAAPWTARIARVSHIDALADACPNCTCRGAATATAS